MMNTNNMKKVNGFDAIRALKEGYIIFDGCSNAYFVMYNKIYKQDAGKTEWNETKFAIENLLYKSYYINRDIPIDKTIEVPLEQNVETIAENARSIKKVYDYADFIIGNTYISATINQDKISFYDGYNIPSRAIVKNFDDLFESVNIHQLKVV